MREEIHLGGSGGQGILLLGNLLAYGGLKAGLEIAWIPSYGAERRGGVSFCAVTLSDRPIACPLTDRPDLILAMDQRALKTHLPRVRSGGRVVLNENLVTGDIDRDDVRVLRIPLNRIAEEAGSPLTANMAALGAILRANPVLPLETVRETLPSVLGTRKSRFVPVNLEALRRGYDRASELLAAAAR